MSWGRRWAQYVNAAGKQHCGTQAGGAVRTCLPMAETLEEPLERCTWSPRLWQALGLLICKMGQLTLAPGWVPVPGVGPELLRPISGPKARLFLGGDECPVALSLLNTT